MINIRKLLVDDDLKQRANEIRAIIERIFKDGGCFHAPYYTLHTPKHFQNIENLIGRLLPPDVAKKLNQYELFFILNSIWLHDVGMIIKKSKDEDAEIIREYHEQRTERFIWENQQLPLEDIERAIISKICKFHRKRERSIDLDPTPIPIHNDRVRIYFIAALLRLADACDIDFTRAPQQLYEILKDTMPEQSEIHWIRHKLVTGIDFIYNDCTIIISYLLPSEDYKPIAELIANKLDDELEFLNKFGLINNQVTYTLIKRIINYNKNMEVPQTLYKAILTIKTMQPQPPSAGKVTELLAELIINESEDTLQDERFIENVKMITELVNNLRPNIFSTHKLRKEIINIINEAQYTKLFEARERILNCAKRYIDYRTNAIDKIGEMGSAIIEDGDIIIHCGYSEPVFSVLRFTAAQGKKIKVISPEMRPRTKTDEGFLVARESTKLGFKSMMILDAAIAYFMPKITKVLMGCKGIFRDGSIMNATGALNIAILSKHFGVPLYIFAESSKITYNYEDIEHRPIDEIFDDHRIKQVADFKIDILNPASDIVPPGCISEIITEIGIFKPEQIKQVLDQL